MNSVGKYKTKEKYHCARCKVDVLIPNFPEAVKIEIKDLLLSEQPLNAMNYIINKSELGIFYSKVLIDHLNKNHGSCTRCSYSELTKENSFCPKCNGFNLNW